MIKNNLLSVGYKVLLVVVCTLGQSLSLFVVNGISTYRYFTHQSNLLVLVFFVISIISTIKDIKHYGVYSVSNHFRRFKGAVIMCISITSLVYNFVIGPASTAVEGFHYAYHIMNNIVHRIVPIMVILDTILFDSRKNYKITDPILWLIAPLVYGIYTFIRAEVGTPFSNGSMYPYFFLDINKYGVKDISRNILYLASFFLTLGYVIYFLDRITFKNKVLDNLE